jgi:hypothetical protein
MPWAILTGALLVLSLQGAERIVDLSRADENRAGRHTSDSSLYQLDCRGRATGRSESTPPLRLTVAGLNSLEYAMGGEIMAVLRVTNVGQQPVILPAVYSHEFGGGFNLPPYALQASLGISIVDAQGREHTLAGTILRGSPSRFGTTESIAPGESITVRFPGWILNADGPAAPASGDAQLFASLILRDNECRTWKALRSDRVKIRMNGRN